MGNETLAREIINLLPADAITGLPTLIDIGIAAGIIFIVYIGVLIAKTIISIRNALRIKSIEKNVDEINQKLNKIIHKKRKN